MRRMLSMLMSVALMLSVATISVAAVEDETPTYTAGDELNITVEDEYEYTPSMAGLFAYSYKDGDTIGEGDVDINVITKVNQYTHVYAVSYSTSELTFEYVTLDMTWNPIDMEYQSQVGNAPGWKETAQDVTVTNFSDLPIAVSASIAKEANAEVEFDVSSGFTLDSAYNKTTQKAAPTSDTFTVSVKDGQAPLNEYSTATKFATMTITVKAVGDTSTDLIN